LPLVLLAHIEQDDLLGLQSLQAPLFDSLSAQHSAPLRIYDRSVVWVATLHAGVDLSEENLLHDLVRCSPPIPDSPPKGDTPSPRRSSWRTAGYRLVYHRPL